MFAFRVYAHTATNPAFASFSHKEPLRSRSLLLTSVYCIPLFRRLCKYLTRICAVFAESDYFPRRFRSACSCMHDPPEAPPHSRAPRPSCAEKHVSPRCRASAPFSLLLVGFRSKTQAEIKKRNTRLRLRSPSNMDLSYRLLPNFSSLFIDLFVIFTLCSDIYSHFTLYFRITTHIIFISFPMRFMLPSYFHIFRRMLSWKTFILRINITFHVFLNAEKKRKTAAALELSNAATVYISRYYYFVVSSLTFSRTHSRWQSGVSEGTVQSAPTTMPTLPVSSKRPSVNF